MWMNRMLVAGDIPAKLREQQVQKSREKTGVRCFFIFIG